MSCNRLDSYGFHERFFFVFFFLKKKKNKVDRSERWGNFALIEKNYIEFFCHRGFTAKLNSSVKYFFLHFFSIQPTGDLRSYADCEPLPACSGVSLTTVVAIFPTSPPFQANSSCSLHQNSTPHSSFPILPSITQPLILSSNLAKGMDP